MDQNINNKGTDGIYKNKNKNIIYCFINEKIKKEENQKYFVSIKNNNKEQYVGALTNNLKKELFGYSLFNQGDEYLGEIHEEKKDGFGIYIFKIKDNNNQDKQDIYIGNFTNNTMNGKGIYINIIEEKDITKGEMNKYICYIGTFENGLFKKGKIYFYNPELEKLYFKNDENEESNFFIEKKKDTILVSKGIMKNDKLCEGIMINFIIKDDKEIIEKKFSFKKKDNSQYIFQNFNDGKFEKEIIDEFNKYKLDFIKYNNIIVKLVNDIIGIFVDFKRDINYSQYVIQNNFKKNILDENTENILFA